MSDLADRAEESIHLQALLPPGSAVLVATSGGVDSMVLLHILHRLSAKYRWTIEAAHFNHKLRGRSSERDEALVGCFCEKNDIPFLRGDGDVHAHAREKRVSLEMAARELRHAFLARTALERGITIVATAHHADDQVELLVLRLMRGGGAGLAGMKWRAPSPANPRVQLVRPFLNQAKARLRDYARRRGIAFREDASNRENRILRNRIRNQLLPFLCRVQPSFMLTAQRSMEIIGAESEFAQLAAQQWLEGQKRPRFGMLHPAVQRQVIQAQLIQTGICPGFDLIESLRLRPNRVVTVAPGCDLLCDGQGRISSRSRSGFNESQKKIAFKGFAGKIEFNGLTLRWSVVRRSTGGPRGSNGPKGREWFDARKVGKKAILRHWQPGDRFQPIGMPRPVKLQDFLTNQKIPRERRRKLVIATTGRGDVFWVEGARIGEMFKLDSTTEHRLEWHWSRQAASD